MYRWIRSDIYFDRNEELDIDYYSDSHGGLSSIPGKGKQKTPYRTNDKLLNGHTVYSVYSFSNSNQVDIFREIKKGSMKKDLYQEWIDRTAQYILETILYANEPDVIALPQSSSSLVEDLAKSIWRQSGYRIEYLPNAFVKNPVEKITIEAPAGVSLSPSTEKNLQKILDNIIKRGSFESKSVPKSLLKFFRNIYTNDDFYNDQLDGKIVAVLDDSMTSRATMSNIFDVCDYVYNCEDSYGITIFKKSGTK